VLRGFSFDRHSRGREWWVAVVPWILAVPYHQGMRCLTLLMIVPAMAFAAAQPPPISPSEAKRKTFDIRAAQEAASIAATEWQASYNCVTCHTNGLFLVAGATSSVMEKPYQQTRAFATTYLDRYLKESRDTQGQHGAIEGIVATSAFLAIGEARGQGDVSPEAMSALRHALSLMSDQGHFASWLTCDWPPFEVDHHFGSSLLLVALGGTTEMFRKESVVVDGMTRLRTWLKNHPPINAHQAGMCLWADATGGIALTSAQRKEYITRYRTLQREDGGWSVFGIGEWARPDGTPQVDQSEAYATAFMVFVLRQAGVPSQDEVIQQGLAWLRANQRESGRWFNRSPHRDRRHFLSNAATNFSLLAFEVCEEETASDPFHKEGLESEQ
jgi:squalene-hopene/tetraprenyl-beta-curcumene cyclase